MQHHPEQRLLLCPVDMPDLTLAALHSLLAAAAASPGRLQLAHDGTRLQPLLGLYPSSAPIRAHLAAAVQRGERGFRQGCGLGLDHASSRRFARRTGFKTWSPSV
jgi:molybdopterin-guanine dinucleotide biosynthesis protein A